MGFLKIYNLYTNQCQCCCVTCTDLGYLEVCPTDQTQVPDDSDEINFNKPFGNATYPVGEGDGQGFGPYPRGRTGTPLMLGVGGHVDPPNPDNNPNKKKAQMGPIPKPETLKCKTTSVACPSNPGFQLTCCKCELMPNSQNG